MKVLLTGATGFIGSHVARQLVHAGDEVHALVREQSNRHRIEDIQPSLHLFPVDLLDSSFLLPPSSFDCCIHLAWYVEPGQYLESSRNQDHFRASLNLARQLQKLGCPRLVASGTCFEYDTSLGTLTESSPTRPQSLYAQTKLALFHELQTCGLETAWTRFFYQYGPFEDPRRLMPVIIRALLHGRPAPLTPGEQVRDFLHVEDVAAAVCAVARSRLTGAVNIGSAQPVTVRQIARKIGELMNRPDLIQLGAVPYDTADPMKILADNSRLRQNTAWMPRFDLDSGLRQTIAWWKTQ